jgi:hypothetical protein
VTQRSDRETIEMPNLISFSTSLLLVAPDGGKRCGRLTLFRNVEK